MPTTIRDIGKFFSKTTVFSSLSLYTAVLIVLAKFRKFLFRHKLVCQKFSVGKQRKRRNGTGRVFCLLQAVGMKNVHRHADTLSDIAVYRHIFCRKRTLICIIHRKSGALALRFFRVRQKTDICFIIFKIKFQKFKIRLSLIAHLKTLMQKEFFIRKKRSFLIRRYDAKSFFPFCLLSRAHSSSRISAFPCPLNCPDTQRQSIYIYPSACTGTHANCAGYTL